MSEDTLNVELTRALETLDRRELEQAVVALARCATGQAFLVDLALGSVIPANPLARAATSGEHERVLACARQPSTCACGCTFLPLTPADGEGVRLLVLRRPASDQLSTRLARAAALWSLTDKQLEVLSLVVVGLANKELAAKLQCAESTVEAHVTRLLARAGASQRGALIYLFWSET